MAKKLTVEVDADTTKAKRKIQELAHLADSPDGGTAAKNVARDLNSAATAAKKIAEAMDKQSTAAENAGSLSKAQADHLATASNAAKKLAYSTYEGNANLRAMTKVFGGMAIRMATNYAAQNMEPGSAGQMAVKAGGEVFGGALAGAAFGPLGAVAGGLMGLTSALMEASQAEKERAKAIEDASKDYRKSEHDYRSSKAWSEELKGLSKVETGFTDFAGRIEKVNELLEHYKQVEGELQGKIESFIKGGKLAEANMERGYLSSNRSRQEQLESLRERLVEMSKKTPPEARASMDALDSLARVGGNFAGSDAGFRDLQRVNEKQVAILEKIEAKTGKGSGTF